MNTVAKALSDLRIGDLMTHEGLTVHPLVRDNLLNKDYLTLDEALAQSAARVVEISEGGSVPHLLFSNRGAQAVFLLDGEELVGAKQKQKRDKNQQHTKRRYENDCKLFVNCFIKNCNFRSFGCHDTTQSRMQGVCYNCFCFCKQPPRL